MTDAPAPGFDLDAMLERAARLLALGIVAWSLWDAIGEWRRRQIVAELRRLVPAVADPPHREPSPEDIAAVLRRADELTHDGMELGPDGH